MHFISVFEAQIILDMYMCVMYTLTHLSCPLDCYSNIYWTDAGAKSISVAKSDGRYTKILFSSGLEYPLALALNPRNGSV